MLRFFAPAIAAAIMVAAFFVLAASAQVGLDGFGHVPTDKITGNVRHSGNPSPGPPPTPCTTFVTDYSQACNLIVLQTIGIAR